MVKWSEPRSDQIRTFFPLDFLYFQIGHSPTSHQKGSLLVILTKRTKETTRPRHTAHCPKRCQFLPLVIHSINQDGFTSIHPSYKKVPIFSLSHIRASPPRGNRNIELVRWMMDLGLLASLYIYSCLWEMGIRLTTLNATINWTQQVLNMQQPNPPALSSFR